MLGLTNYELVARVYKGVLRAHSIAQNATYPKRCEDYFTTELTNYIKIAEERELIEELKEVFSRFGLSFIERCGQEQASD